jgi:Lrp/AsnC family leucine-responsive transcriptional regulator
VQEVHIITGDWDLLIKLRAENVDKIGKFVVDKLRAIKGIEKTLTCLIFETVKETTRIALPLRRQGKPA